MVVVLCSSCSVVVSKKSLDGHKAFEGCNLAKEREWVVGKNEDLVDVEESDFDLKVSVVL